MSNQNNDDLLWEVLTYDQFDKKEYELQLQ